MLGVLVPGRIPVYSFEQVSNNQWVVTLEAAHTIRELVFYLVGDAPLASNDMAAAMFIASPCNAFSLEAMSSWRYLGTISNQSPSAVFHVRWTEEELEAFTRMGNPVIQVGVSLESALTVASMVPDGFLSNEHHFARGIARDLFNYMQSFARPMGPSGEMIAVSSDVLDRWYTRFCEKFERDPVFRRRLHSSAMFTTVEKLREGHGRRGPSRFRYLQTLVTEFQDTTSQDAKEQVLANLGNFAYDPVNYGWLRDLHIIDLFADALTETNERMVRFAMGGLCNLCCDPQNATIILSIDAVPLIVDCLTSADEETVLSAMTTLHFLATMISSVEAELRKPLVVALLDQYTASPNRKLSNVARVVRRSEQR